MEKGFFAGLEEKKNNFFDKHFNSFFSFFLIVFYIITIMCASFFASTVVEFSLSESEEIVWRDIAISLNEEHKDSKVTLKVNNADVTVDNGSVYIWRGITKPTITYDFSKSKIEPNINNVWCILLAIPIFFVAEMLVTLIFGGALYLVVKTERFICKKLRCA